MTMNETLAVLPTSCDRADVGVVQAGGAARFAQEPLRSVLVTAGAPGENLDRNVALQSVIAGEVDLPHATGADLGGDFVGTEPGARG